MAAEEMNRLYDRDFFEWTGRVARLLREGRFSEVDVEHLAEEIEDAGKRDQRGVWGHLRVVIHHLLKWQVQPQKRTGSWKTSISTHRQTLLDIFGQSPSLKRHAREELAQTYDEALRRAMDETGLARECFPPECPYTFDQVMDFDFLPDSESNR
jgi:Domain of unknown function DUF29